MGFLTDWLTDWLKSLLIEGILGNLSGLFDTVNARVGEIAGEVGTTPAAWNAGVFSLIRQISETVILPIAGLVLACPHRQCGYVTGIVPDYPCDCVGISSNRSSNDRVREQRHPHVCRFSHPLHLPSAPSAADRHFACGH